jgi:integrase
MSRELMALLLSGLTLKECAALEPEDFDLEAGTLLAPSEPPRAIPLAPPIARLFAACRPLPLWAGGVGHLSADELSMRIALLAHDAGLAQAAEIDAETLRHTYIAYLVRQGARLTELPRLLGPMPPSALARYTALAPAGPARSLDQIAVTYPTLDRAGL